MFVKVPLEICYNNNSYIGYYIIENSKGVRAKPLPFKKYMSRITIKPQ